MIKILSCSNCSASTEPHTLGKGSILNAEGLRPYGFEDAVDASYEFCVYCERLFCYKCWEKHNHE